MSLTPGISLPEQPSNRDPQFLKVERTTLKIIFQGAQGIFRNLRKRPPGGRSVHIADAAEVVNLRECDLNKLLNSMI
jgi:hypothetical protein